MALPASPSARAPRFVLTALSILGLLAVAPVAANAAEWNVAVNVSPSRLAETGGGHGVVLHPNVTDRLTLLVSHDGGQDGCRFVSFQPPRLEGRRIVLAGEAVESGVAPCTPQREQQQFTVEPLGAPGVYTLEATVDGVVALSQRIDVASPLHALDVGGLWVQVVLHDTLGPSTYAPAVQLSPLSGYFWFFDPDNVEVTVKVLDGRPINGHRWVFLEGMSNLGFTVIVTEPCLEPGSCPSKTYVNPPGKVLNLVDVNFCAGESC